jgi:hypothetical protein
MAKFAAVQLRDNQEINKNAFKRFTISELRNKIKCKEVLEVKYNKKSNAKLSKMTDIDEYKLNQLSGIMSSSNLDDMTENSYISKENTKIFIFSDDASSTALAFDVLNNNCMIKLFELNNEEITNFMHSIATIQSADDLISSLDEAKELCESLNRIESDVGLTLVYRSAEDEIEEKISDIESDVETSKETLEEIFEAKWD